MNIDLAALTLPQIAVTLLAIAVLRFLAGFGAALGSRTVLWTYVDTWIIKAILPALVLTVAAAIGQGIAAINLPAVPAVWWIFVAAAGTYAAAALAAIASALGVDLTTLPGATSLRSPVAVVAAVVGPTPSDGRMATDGGTTAHFVSAAVDSAGIPLPVLPIAEPIPIPIPIASPPDHDVEPADASLEPEPEPAAADPAIPGVVSTIGGDTAAVPTPADVTSLAAVLADMRTAIDTAIARIASS